MRVKRFASWPRWPVCALTRPRLAATTCVSSDWTYSEKLMAYTGFPLAVFALLAIPS